MPSTKDTAIVLIDPYNDFLHPDGKLTPRLADSLAKTNTIAHIKTLLTYARSQKIPVYYGLHQQFHAGQYDDWKHMTASQVSLRDNKVFEEGSWGAQFYEGLEPDFSNGDVVVSKHWNSSSFANTDLHFQLQEREIKKVVFAGLVANTCVESTARYAYELQYHVTMLSDATAGFTQEAKVAATTLIWPLFANEVTTVGAWIEKQKKETV
ncbi:Isochorismatase-like protein [Mycena capillaripes]|nr:Isochorismatase-like protein [Mycena capillaripes]